MFRPEDFLILARRLLNEGNDEATLRTAISRAYYSLFLSLRERADAGGASHKRFWTGVEEIDPELARLGQRFRTLRNAADYGDPLPNLRVDAVRWVRRAELLISRSK